jgi:hypothetical protein
MGLKSVELRAHSKKFLKLFMVKKNSKLSLKESLSAKEKLLASNPELQEYENRIQELLDKAGNNRLAVIQFLHDELKQKTALEYKTLIELCEEYINDLE